MWGQVVRELTNFTELQLIGILGFVDEFNLGHLLQLGQFFRLCGIFGFGGDLSETGKKV